MSARRLDYQLTAYDALVILFLLGSLISARLVGVMSAEGLFLSLLGAFVAVSVYSVMRRGSGGSDGSMGLRRKFPHLIGGSVLLLGLIWYPTDLPFLVSTLFATYLLYEVLRWQVVKRRTWTSHLLSFYGSPEEESGRPFWEAILGLGSICFILHLFDAEIAMVSMINLTFGDGVAGLTREILRENARSFGARKGWWGSIAGTVTSSALVLALTGKAAYLIPVALGMLIERLPIPVEDNLTVSLSTALCAWLLSRQGPSSA
jgi:dolichol kinase